MIVAVVAISAAAGMLIGAAVREACQRIELAADLVAAPPTDTAQAAELARAEAAAADESIDRLLLARRGPIDPRDAELWARQILAHDSDDLIRASALGDDDDATQP